MHLQSAPRTKPQRAVGIAAATVFGAALFFSLHGAKSASAANATGTANANVVKAIAIGTLTNLRFGNIAPTGVAGSVVISPNVIPAANVRTAINVSLLPPGAPSVGPASFQVEGQPGEQFAVTYPVNPFDITNTTGPGLPMSVTLDGTVPSGAGLTLPGGGALNFTVGATLNVDGAQAPGSYEGTFSVQVDYF